jgi:hypothetical protein
MSHTLRNLVLRYKKPFKVIIIFHNIYIDTEVKK